MVEWPKAGEKAILAWLESAGYVAMNLSPMMVIAFHRDDPVRKHIVENPPEQE
jgi:hypothetical protein